MPAQDSSSSDTAVPIKVPYSYPARAYIWITSHPGSRKRFGTLKSKLTQTETSYKNYTLCQLQNCKECLVSPSGVSSVGRAIDCRGHVRRHQLVTGSFPVPRKEFRTTISEDWHNMSLEKQKAPGLLFVPESNYPSHKSDETSKVASYIAHESWSALYMSKHIQKTISSLKHSSIKSYPYLINSILFGNYQYVCKDTCNASTVRGRDFWFKKKKKQAHVQKSMDSTSTTL